MVKEGFAEVYNLRIHYKMVGKFSASQPFVVFLHEGLGSIPQWRDFPEKLCHNLDLPFLIYERAGYGKSSAASERREKDFLQHEGCIILPQLLKVLNLSQEHFVFGHSDGATIALYYASTNPEKLLKSVVEAPHVFLEDISRQGIENVEKAFRVGKLAKALDKYHTPHTKNVVLSWTQYWLDQNNAHWNMFASLEKIATPILFIQGQNDNFGTFAQADMIESRTQAAFEKLLLADCGHSPHFEKPSAVIRSTMAFFQ